MARLEDGIVEVFLNGSWLAVCGEEWGILEAKVICRQLGYLGADSNQSTAPIANASHAVWSRGLQCAGNEDDLSNCYGSSNWRFTECGNSRAASVVCTLQSKSLGLHVSVKKWTISFVFQIWKMNGWVYWNIINQLGSY